LEKTNSKWRWGTFRWILLSLILLSIATTLLISPTRPYIQVAPETLSGKLILPLIGSIYLSNTITMMLVVDAIILIMAFAVRQATRRGELIPKGIAGVLESAIEALYNLTETSAGKWAKTIYPWFATITLIVLVANLTKLLPGVETIGFLEHHEKGFAIKEIGLGLSTVVNQEVDGGGGYIVIPWLRALSTDLNFTVALALISVVMTQVIGFRAQGFGYLSKYLNFRTMFKRPFFGFMDFLVGLLETISELAKVLSFSFRLFGNMFAGMVLMALVGSMLPIFIPSMILMFEFFIGLIQAFVFGMLTMVFMAQATRGHADESHAE
jgi:F-type H+-transporting ATPase subunit a